MPHRVTKYGLTHNGRRIHHYPVYLGGKRLPLMSKDVAEKLADELSHGTHVYKAVPVREKVKSGYKARSKRAGRTLESLRGE